MTTPPNKKVKKYSERHIRRIIDQETQSDMLLLSNIPGCSHWPDTQSDIYTKNEVPLQCV